MSLSKDIFCLLFKEYFDDVSAVRCARSAHFFERFLTDDQKILFQSVKNVRRTQIETLDCLTGSTLNGICNICGTIRPLKVMGKHQRKCADIKYIIDKHTSIERNQRIRTLRTKEYLNKVCDRCDAPYMHICYHKFNCPLKEIKCAFCKKNFSSKLFGSHYEKHYCFAKYCNLKAEIFGGLCKEHGPKPMNCNARTQEGYYCCNKLGKDQKHCYLHNK